MWYVCACVFMVVCVCVCEGLTGCLNENENCSIIHKAVCRTLLPKNMFYESCCKWWCRNFPLFIYFTDLTNCRQESILHLSFMLGCLMYSLNSENSKRTLRENIRFFIMLHYSAVWNLWHHATIWVSFHQDIYMKPLVSLLGLCCRYEIFGSINPHNAASAQFKHLVCLPVLVPLH